MGIASTGGMGGVSGLGSATKMTSNGNTTPPAPPQNVAVAADAISEAIVVTPAVEDVKAVKAEHD